MGLRGVHPQARTQLKEAKVKIDASIGVVQWQMGQTVKELVASADSAMYRAKAVAAGQKA